MKFEALRDVVLDGLQVALNGAVCVGWASVLIVSEGYMSMLIVAFRSKDNDGSISKNNSALAAVQ